MRTLLRVSRALYNLIYLFYLSNQAHKKGPKWAESDCAENFLEKWILILFEMEF